MAIQMDINNIAQDQINHIKNKCETIRPLVVILSITYNHERFIRDALDGFVMQKTDFPFVVIVHDDASTDKTAEIIKKYIEKYPNMILPIYEEENQYSKKNRGVGIIMDAAWRITGAKYIAMCEGDDYWTDPLKLQKQVDFLESHPDYSMYFHEAEIVNETSTDFSYLPLEDRAYSSVEVFRNWCVPTASILIRKEALEVPIDKDFMSGDIVLILNAAKLGRIYGSSMQMSAYRVQCNGVTISRLSTPITHYQKEINHYKAIYRYFPEITKKEFHRKISNSYINLGVNELKNNKLKGLNYIGRGVINSPVVFFKRLYNLLKK